MDEQTESRRERHCLTSKHPIPAHASPSCRDAYAVASPRLCFLHVYHGAYWFRASGRPASRPLTISAPSAFPSQGNEESEDVRRGSAEANAVDWPRPFQLGSRTSLSARDSLDSFENRMPPRSPSARPTPSIDADYSMGLPEPCSLPSQHWFLAFPNHLDEGLSVSSRYQVVMPSLSHIKPILHPKPNVREVMGPVELEHADAMF